MTGGLEIKQRQCPHARRPGELDEPRSSSDHGSPCRDRPIDRGSASPRSHLRHRKPVTRRARWDRWPAVSPWWPPGPWAVRAAGGVGMAIGSAFFGPNRRRPHRAARLSQVRRTRATSDTVVSTTTGDGLLGVTTDAGWFVAFKATTTAPPARQGFSGNRGQVSACTDDQLKAAVSMGLQADSRANCWVPSSWGGWRLKQVLRRHGAIELHGRGLRADFRVGRMERGVLGPTPALPGVRGVVAIERWSPEYSVGRFAAAGVGVKAQNTAGPSLELAPLGSTTAASDLLPRPVHRAQRRVALVLLPDNEWSCSSTTGSSPLSAPIRIIRHDPVVGEHRGHRRTRSSPGSRSTRPVCSPSGANGIPGQALGSSANLAISGWAKPSSTDSG